MRTKEIIGVASVSVLFLLGLFIADRYAGYLALYLDHGAISIVLYACFGIVATVVAPVSTIPLIPIAVALWGPLATTLINVCAWTIGGIIAFLIARRFGKPIVERFASLEKVLAYERVLGDTYLFWNLVLLRALVPVDVLSYAVGLVSTVSLPVYAGATFIGIIPFAFIFSYVPVVPLSFQLFAAALVAGAAYAGYRKVRIKNLRP